MASRVMIAIMWTLGAAASAQVTLPLEVVRRWNEQEAHGRKAVPREQRWIGRPGGLKVAILG